MSQEQWILVVAFDLILAALLLIALSMYSLPSAFHPWEVVSWEDDEMADEFDLEDDPLLADEAELHWAEAYYRWGMFLL